MDGNKKGVGLTAKIFAGLISGLAAGICLHYFPYGRFTREFITDGIFIFRKRFLRLMQMLVVPLVLLRWCAEVHRLAILRLWAK